MTNISVLDILVAISAVFTVVGVIYTIRSFYKKKNSHRQTAVGKYIYQAGRDIKVERGNGDKTS
ncbi:MAG: hypothetical protein AB9872_09410 [Solidesulfovibrio sp.]